LNGTGTKQKRISENTRSALRKPKQFSMIPFLVTFPDEYHSENEERWISIGMSSKNRILIVAHTETVGNDKIVIGIINSRKAVQSERKIYEE